MPVTIDSFNVVYVYFLSFCSEIFDKIGEIFYNGFRRFLLMGGSIFIYFWELGKRAVDTVILKSFSFVGLLLLLFLLIDGRFFILSYDCFILFVLEFFS